MLDTLNEDVLSDAVEVTLAQKCAAALPECLDDVLSTMFFTGVLQELGGNAHLEPPLIGVIVTFSGTLSGALHLALQMDLAAALVEDFSGGEGPLNQDNVESAVCELANMICGATLSRIAPDAQVLLSHPEIAAEMDPQAAQPRFFELVSGTIALSMRID